jgi:hypothetical protein
MHVVMTLTGGFTGVGGRWEANANSFNSAAGGNSKFDELARLVQQARAQGALGRDFSESKGAMPQPFPDAQTYDIEVDGEHVRWTEPPPNDAAAAPPVLQSLKAWLIDNVERQPYTRR